MTVQYTKLIYRLLIIIVILLIINNETSADNKYYVGLGIGFNKINSITNKPYIGDDRDCGLFSDGESKGYSAFLKVGYVLLPDFLNADAKIIYDHRPTSFVGKSDCFEILDPNSNQYVPLVRKHNFIVEQSFMTIDFGISFQPFKQLPFSMRFSFDAGSPIFKSEYYISERIVSPSGIRYENNLTTRINERGSLESASSSYGASVSALYALEISDDLHLEFELSRRFPLNSEIINYVLKNDILRANVSLLYLFNSNINEYEPIIPTNVHSQVLEIQEINDKPGNNILLNKVEIEEIDIVETVVTQTFPLLPYYFFDEKSAELPNKYKSSETTRDFSEQNLKKETMNIYYNSLDIIGSRLRASNEIVRIVGHSDGKEFDSLEKRLELAKLRAFSVAEYLNKRWNIPTRRLIVEAKDLPLTPTSSVYKEANEENRRVEIISTSSMITAPVVHRDFLEYYSQSSKIDVSLEMANAESALIEINSDSAAIIKNQLSDLNEKSVVKTQLILNQDIINSLAIAEKHNSNSLYINLSNSQGSENYKLPFKVNLIKEQFEIGRLNLIVFDFDKSIMSNLNKEMLETFSKSSIKPNSEISIVGTTDILGDRDYNKTLSQKRAENSKSIISSALPKANFVKVLGTGAEIFKHSNYTPEGRFYNRTVLIEVKTKIND